MAARRELLKHFTSSFIFCLQPAGFAFVNRAAQAKSMASALRFHASSARTEKLSLGLSLFFDSYSVAIVYIATTATVLFSCSVVQFKEGTNRENKNTRSAKPICARSTSVFQRKKILSVAFETLVRVGFVRQRPQPIFFFTAKSRATQLRCTDVIDWVAIVLPWNPLFGIVFVY